MRVGLFLFVALILDMCAGQEVDAYLRSPLVIEGDEGTKNVQLNIVFRIYGKKKDKVEKHVVFNKSIPVEFQTVADMADIQDEDLKSLYSGVTEDLTRVRLLIHFQGEMASYGSRFNDDTLKGFFVLPINTTETVWGAVIKEVDMINEKESLSKELQERLDQLALNAKGALLQTEDRYLYLLHVRLDPKYFNPE